MLQNTSVTLQVTFLNITGFRDFPLGDMPMLEVPSFVTSSVPSPRRSVETFHLTFACFLQVLRRASEKVFVPLTVGGGIRDFTDKEGRYEMRSRFMQTAELFPSLLSCVVTGLGCAQVLF